MTTEITKGVIAVLITIGAIASIFIGNVEAQTFLIPLATFAFGYYFKQIEAPLGRKIQVALSKK